MESIKSRLKYEKKYIMNALARYDREAKEKKRVHAARRKSWSELIKERIAGHKQAMRFGVNEKAEIARIKNDQKENKKLIKMSEKETKLRRSILEYSLKNERMVLTDKERAKYLKMQKELTRFLEEKEGFKQQIKARITEEMKNKPNLDITPADRDYKAMRFEQLDREDYSYVVLHNDAEIAVANGTIPLELQEKTGDELAAHYEKTARHYAPDVQARLERIEANRETQKNWKANRIEEMNAAREREMNESTREKFSLKDVVKTESQKEEPKIEKEDNSKEEVDNSKEEVDNSKEEIDNSKEEVDNSKVESKELDDPVL